MQNTGINVTYELLYSDVIVYTNYSMATPIGWEEPFLLVDPMAPTLSFLILNSAPLPPEIARDINSCHVTATSVTSDLLDDLFYLSSIYLCFYLLY